jgi:hypothetical protein
VVGPRGADRVRRPVKRRGQATRCPQVSDRTNASDRRPRGLRARRRDARRHAARHLRAVSARAVVAGRTIGQLPGVVAVSSIRMTRRHRKGGGIFICHTLTDGRERCCELQHWRRTSCFAVQESLTPQKPSRQFSQARLLPGVPRVRLCEIGPATIPPTDVAGPNLVRAHSVGSW